MVAIIPRTLVRVFSLYTCLDLNVIQCTGDKADIDLIDNILMKTKQLRCNSSSYPVTNPPPSTSSQFT